MRVLGLALAGVLALTAPIAAQTSPLRPRVNPAAPVPGVVQVWDGNRPVPNGRAGGWHQVPGRSRQWNGAWVPRHWGPNGTLGGLGFYPGPGVPTYWVWGPSGGAFDYPFADWRGPTGGLG
jgi:hypothetical protein